MTKDWVKAAEEEREIEDERFNRDAGIKPIPCTRCKKTANGRVAEPYELIGIPYCWECADYLDINLDTQGYRKHILVELMEEVK